MQPKQQNDHGDSQMEELMADQRKLIKYQEQLEAQCFQLKKNCLKQPQQFKSKKSNAINKQATSLGNIKFQAKRIKLENTLAHHLRYTGYQVKQYSSDTCLVVYDISVVGESVAQFAMKMCKVQEPDDWVLKKYHLPIGFSLAAISNKYALMTKEYLCTIHEALTAHFNRLWQIKLLKEALPKYGDLQHSLDGTYVELSLKLKSQNTNEILDVSFKLQYDPLKTRPSDVGITKFGITDTNSMILLKNQLKPFQLATLQSAFTLSFQNVNDPFTCLTDQDLIYHEKNMLALNGDDMGYPTCWSDDENVEVIQRHRNNNSNDKEFKSVFSNVNNKKSNSKNRDSSNDDSSGDSESDESVKVQNNKNRKEKSQNVRKNSLRESKANHNKKNGKRPTKNLKVVNGKISKQVKNLSSTMNTTVDTTLDTDHDESQRKKQRGTIKNHQRHNKENKKKTQKRK